MGTLWSTDAARGSREPELVVVPLRDILRVALGNLGMHNPISKLIHARYANFRVEDFHAQRQNYATALQTEHGTLRASGSRNDM